MFLKWNFHFCVCWWQFHKDVTICCHLLPPTPWSTTTCLLLALSWRHLEWCSHNYKKWSEVNVTQSCLTLCDRIDYRVHGILQARILEWVAFPFSRGSSQPRDWTQVSHTAAEPQGKLKNTGEGYPIPSPADIPDSQLWKMLIIT